MAIALATLVSRLQAAVPALNGSPTAEQSELAVRDAVADLSARRPRRKRAELAVATGVATYDLPPDFGRVISLESLLADDRETLVTPQGLIPVSATYTETYTVAGGQLTLYPTPEYSATRVLWYWAGYALNDAGVYPDLTETEARLVMLKAQAIGLRLQANRAAQDAWQYAIGDERVSKEKLAEALANQAEAMEQAYQRDLAGNTSRAVGQRAYRADEIWSNQE